MKILAGMIVYHAPYLKTLQSVINLIHKTTKTNPEIDIQFAYQTRTPILYGIQNLIRQAKEEKYDYFFLLHDDLIYPENTITSLLNQDKPVLTGWAYTRNMLATPGLFTLNKLTEIVSIDNHPEIDETVETPVCGGGAMLLRFDALHQISWEDKYIISNRGVDLILSTWIQRAGFKIWVDKSIRLGHVVSPELTINQNTLNTYKSLMGYYPDYNRERKPELKSLIDE